MIEYYRDTKGKLWGYVPFSEYDKHKLKPAGNPAFFNLDCFVCKKNYKDENFQKSFDSTPLYAIIIGPDNNLNIGNITSILHIQCVFCSCECVTEYMRIENERSTEATNPVGS